VALSLNSYGSVGGVAGRAPRYADQFGHFTTITRPTLTTVESWVDQVSGLVNSILAQNRFDVPVTQSDVALLLAGFVEDEVAAMVEGANGSGRFGPTAGREDGRSRWEIIISEVAKFVNNNAAGFEAMGASRSGRLTNTGSRAIIRADGYSNDLSTIKAEQLEWPA
jgi:hypothetical protein